MAALTGVLRADFTEFLTAVDTAETKLTGFQTSSSKVESALNRMVNAFSGQKIISEATLAVEAVERIGGVTALTEKEQQQVNRTVQEAIEKYTALEQTAPPAMIKLAEDTARALAPTQQLDQSMVALGGAIEVSTAPAMKTLGDASGTAGKQGLTLQQNFAQVDKVLAAVGISLGPIPGALQEVMTAATRTAGSLTTMAQAGLAVGAAAAGWNVGRWIAEWGGLDEKIANATSRLMGWGDLAAETAAAKTETLARASALAGHEITNMDQAVQILSADAKELADIAGQAAKAEQELAEFTARLFSQDDIARAQQYVTALDGVQNVSKLTAEKKRELRAALEDAFAAYTAMGETAPRIMRDIHAATTELLTVTKSFSAASSGAWAEFAAGIEDGKQKMAEIAEAAKLHWSDIGGVSKEQLMEIAAARQAEYELALAHSENFTGKQIADFRRAAAEAQAAVEAWGTDTIEAYDAMTQASAASATAQIADVQRVDAAMTTRLTSWSDAMDQVRRGLGTMTGTIAADLSPAGRAATQRAWESGNYWGPVVGGSATNPRGTGVDWARLGFTEDQGTVQAAGRRGAGGTSVTVNTVMGNAQEIARVVQQAILEAARSRGEQLPVGV